MSQVKQEETASVVVPKIGGQWVRGVSLAGAGALGAAALLNGCLDRPVGAPQPVTTNVFTEQLTQSRVEKIDLLFMIDNSASMSDKQATLEQAVPDLVGRLVNPICLDPLGGSHPAPLPGEECPAGQRREFRPVTDINVAVISSSLGDGGANDACVEGATVDGGRLVGSLPRAQNIVPSGSGFLRWREGTRVEEFTAQFQNLVRAVGDRGCGWEANLEAWYRFLIDPVPFAELERVVCSSGDEQANCIDAATDVNGEPLLDEELLRQRSEFLRPDSLLAIVMLTDENDCSIQAGGVSWLMGSLESSSGAFPMFSASAACADNPQSECCYSCFQDAPAGCEWAHTTCEEAEGKLVNRLPSDADHSNLRCYDQKRRFGVDFLYPTQRYVNALSQLSLCPSNADLSVTGCPGQVVSNPLFSEGRTPNNVFLAGIVGVPWQQIAADTDVNGDALSTDQLRFKTASELGDEDWARILGEPQASPPVPPAEPLMQESPFAREGVVSGGANGREFDTRRSGTNSPGELQYACIFPLPEARECEGQDPRDCDCTDGKEGRPLCEEVPGQTPAGTMQYWAKAYPGSRQLEVLKGFGENSIVASICARNVLDRQRPDFGYRPAISSLVDRLKEQLARRCLPRSLKVTADGAALCTLVEARALGEGESCACDSSKARSVPSESLDRATRTQLAAKPGGVCAEGDPRCGNACLCEVQQIAGEEELRACRNDLDPSIGEGWCYLSDTPEQQLGNPALVAECRPTERRLLRFVGSGLAKGAVTVVSCQGQSFSGG